MTVEEARLLQAYLLRHEMGKAVSSKDAAKLSGKTIGDLIKEERDLEATAKAEQAKQDKLAAEAKAKEEAAAQQLRKAINLTVFSKSFLESDFHEGRYEDLIVIACVYENTAGKDVRAFTGAVKFADLFGKEIFTSNLTIQDAVKAGEKATWRGTIRYNQFIESHQALRNAELKDMQITWLPRQILFADGSKIGLDE